MLKSNNIGCQMTCVDNLAASPSRGCASFMWTQEELRNNNNDMELPESFDERKSKWNEPWCELLQNQFCQTLEELAFSEAAATSNRKHNNSPVPGKRRRSSASDYFTDDEDEMVATGFADPRTGSRTGSKDGFLSIGQCRSDNSAQPGERLRNLIGRSEDADEFLKLLRRSLVREYCTGLRSLRNVRFLQPLVSEIDTQLYYETGRQAILDAIDDALENQKDWLRELFHEIPSLPNCFKRFRSCVADDDAENSSDENRILPEETSCNISWNSAKHCCPSSVHNHNHPDIVSYMDALALGNRDMDRASFNVKEQISLIA